jgi:uncharacterized membrane protein YjdF
MRVTKTQIGILIFSILYVLIFGIYYIIKQNYEFLIYVFVLIFFIILVSKLHLRFKFSTEVLLGMSIWGLMHMAGGGVYINGTKLYAIQLIPIVLRYDQFAHFYFYVFATIFMYHVIEYYLDKKKMNWPVVAVFLVFTGMGIGALNEIIEFIAVLSVDSTGVGGYYNTLWDLVFNGFGAIAGVLYLSIKRGIEETL